MYSNMKAFALFIRVAHSRDLDRGMKVNEVAVVTSLAAAGLSFAAVHRRAEHPHLVKRHRHAPTSPPTHQHER